MSRACSSLLITEQEDKSHIVRLRNAVGEDVYVSKPRKEAPGSSVFEVIRSQTISASEAIRAAHLKTPDTSLRRAAKASASLLLTLIGKDRSGHQAFVDALRSLAPHDTSGNLPGLMPVLELAEECTHLFAELLPVNLTIIEALADGAPLTDDEMRESLLGFRCVIRRLPLIAELDSDTPPPLLGGESVVVRPRMRLFLHSRLAGARAEKVLLRSIFADLDAQPVQGDTEESIAVKIALLDAVRGVGTEPPAVDGMRSYVQHFCCHAAAGDHVGSSSLTLHAEDTDDNDEVTVRGNDLEDELALAIFGQAPRVQLTFINACETGMPKGWSAESIMTLFAAQQRPCVVGTRTKVRDDYAACFATSFYELVSTRNIPVGEALVAARTSLASGAAGAGDVVNNASTGIGLNYYCLGDEGATFGDIGHQGEIVDFESIRAGMRDLSQPQTVVKSKVWLNKFLFWRPDTLRGASP